MPETTDKDREEVRKFIRQLEDESNVFAREIFVTDTFSHIRLEAKAEALREAAEMADEAIVRWADPIYVGDMPAEVSELRHKVEYSITHADEPNKEE